LIGVQLSAQVFITQQNKKWGLLDSIGRTIHPFNITKLVVPQLNMGKGGGGPTSEAMIIWKDKKWEIMDFDGKIVFLV